MAELQTFCARLKERTGLVFADVMYASAKDKIELLRELVPEDTDFATLDQWERAVAGERGSTLAGNATVIRDAAQPDHPPRVMYGKAFPGVHTEAGYNRRVEVDGGSPMRNLYPAPPQAASQFHPEGSPGGWTTPFMQAHAGQPRVSGGLGPAAPPNDLALISTKVPSAAAQPESMTPISSVGQLKKKLSSRAAAAAAAARQASDVEASRAVSRSLRSSASTGQAAMPMVDVLAWNNVINRLLAVDARIADSLKTVRDSLSTTLEGDPALEVLQRMGSGSAGAPLANCGNDRTAVAGNAATDAAAATPSGPHDATQRSLRAVGDLLDQAQLYLLLHNVPGPSASPANANANVSANTNRPVSAVSAPPPPVASQAAAPAPMLPPDLIESLQALCSIPLGGRAAASAPAVPIPQDAAPVFGSNVGGTLQRPSSTALPLTGSVPSGLPGSTAPPPSVGPGMRGPPARPSSTPVDAGSRVPSSVPTPMHSQPVLTPGQQQPPPSHLTPTPSAVPMSGSAPMASQQPPMRSGATPSDPDASFLSGAPRVPMPMTAQPQPFQNPAALKPTGMPPPVQPRMPYHSPVDYSSAALPLSSVPSTTLTSKSSLPPPGVSRATGGL